MFDGAQTSRCETGILHYKEYGTSDVVRQSNDIGDSYHMTILKME